MPIAVSILRELLNTANDVTEFLKDAQVPSTALSQALPVLPVVDLPQPPSIHTKLLGLGLAPVLVNALSSKYELRCQELRTRAQTILHRACVDLSAVPRHVESTPLPKLLDSVTFNHTAWYLQSLRELEEHVIALASKQKLSFQQPQARRTSRRTERKPSKPFNREFIPFLEKYFEYNGYPSSADRAEMARKSRMELRQIEVWFQNHRRRAKEEGKTVQKRSATDPAPLMLCLKSMEETMGLYMIPEPLRQEIDSEVSEPGSDDEDEDEDEFDDETPEIIDLTDVLNPPAPRHASAPFNFADCLKNASTNTPTRQFSFPVPQWQRKPATACPRRADITMDQLATSFACLHVRDSRQVLSPPFKIATTVIPPAAPLPSLVRGKFNFKFAPSPVVATTSLNTVPASTFRSPSPSAEPVPASTSPSPRRKKVAGPPRRTPKKRANANIREASPATSDTSTLRSVSPPSRTPSLQSSGGFSLSRTPSFGSSDGFSSRSSSASSGPSTPWGSPSALPLEIVDADAFGDLATYLSPLEEAPAYPQYGKQQERQFGFARYASG
ncbi:Mating-type protein A-alpha Y1 [Mycena sanguinolenta]|uniref:Mating-type protein A-alpha Y1 n=1 Tax=Mycena sanguinolenta TaxID=230812 RepID=A0A8H6XDW2_9AGAR|nr:Mating-type protein A-alpha Y1 [Mycena sanguinolenta]